MRLKASSALKYNSKSMAGKILPLKAQNQARDTINKVFISNFLVQYDRNAVMQSNLGLRTQFVLESCSKTELFENRIIFSHYK